MADVCRQGFLQKCVGYVEGNWCWCLLCLLKVRTICLMNCLFECVGRFLLMNFEVLLMVYENVYLAKILEPSCPILMLKPAPLCCLDMFKLILLFIPTVAASIYLIHSCRVGNFQKTTTSQSSQYLDL